MYASLQGVWLKASKHVRPVFRVEGAALVVAPADIKVCFALWDLKLIIPASGHTFG